MSSKSLYIAILFFSVFISAVSQLLLKKAALRKYESVVKEYLNALVIVAYAIYFIAVFMDVLALRKVPVSYVPAIEASGYVFIILLSRIFLKESFSKKKILAMVLILFGILIYLL